MLIPQNSSMNIQPKGNLRMYKKTQLRASQDCNHILFRCRQTKTIAKEHVGCFSDTRPLAIIYRINQNSAGQTLWSSHQSRWIKCNLSLHLLVMLLQNYLFDSASLMLSNRFDHLSLVLIYDQLLVYSDSKFYKKFPVIVRSSMLFPTALIVDRVLVYLR